MTQKINRRTFLQHSTTSTALIVAAANAQPAHAPDWVELGATTDFKADTIIDLKKTFGLILSHTKNGLIALAPACTHQGCATQRVAALEGLVCPCHGARFTTDGSVTKGPARKPLGRYALEIKDGKVFADKSHVIAREKVQNSDFVKP